MSGAGIVRERRAERIGMGADGQRGRRHPRAKTIALPFARVVTSYRLGKRGEAG